MINEIIEAISMALNEEFGDEYEIHMEEIRQGLKEPCFFISCVSPQEKKYPGGRYLRNNQFCIQYFPETNEKQRECNSVGEEMMGCLEYITIYGEDKPIIGTGMRYETVDGVLNFFVNYDCFLRTVKDDYKMEHMTDVENAKG